MTATPGEKNFERRIDGKMTRLLFIRNKNGMEASISNYGARIISLVFNDVNVVPVYESLEPYTLPTVAPYHGATVGRYANRIAEGKFSLNGNQYSLPLNNGLNHLHGAQGFHQRVWDVVETKENEVKLSYFSKDGEEGYPGNLTVSVTYTLSDNDELILSYEAKTDAATPFNITNHAFFNLNGEGNVLDHQLQINANCFIPVDETLVPTGEIKKVTGTAFDFRQTKKLGKDIDNDEEQIKIGGGYDHNFVLNKNSNELSFAAKAIGDKSGIVMEILTTEPGLQFFSGNFEAAKGDPSTYRNSFCLETQHFPDSPNQPSFPNTILKPGEIFSSTTVHRFTNEN